MIYNWQAKEPFEGHISMEVLLHDDRMKILSDLNLEAGSGGEVKLNKDMISQLSKMKTHVAKYIKEVRLVHIETGTVFNSLADLEYYEEYQEVLNELSGIMLNGVKLGNGLRKASNNKRSGPVKA